MGTHDPTQKTGSSQMVRIGDYLVMIVGENVPLKHVKDLYFLKIPRPNKEDLEQQDAEEDEEDDPIWWQNEIESLRKEIDVLRTKNANLEDEVERMKETEKSHLVMISNLEQKTAAIMERMEEMN